MGTYSYIAISTTHMITTNLIATNKNKTLNTYLTNGLYINHFTDKNGSINNQETTKEC